MDALTDFDLSALERRFCEWGAKPVHARRVIRAFYDGAGAPALDAIEIGATVRKGLASEIRLRQSHTLTRHTSGDGTTKFVVGFDAGGAAEAVLMPGHRADRAAGCVSSQIGCAMGCDFCATARGGLVRNLSAGEIVEQFLTLKSAAAETGRRLTSLVFMGQGEPLQNFDNVVAAIRRIADPAMGALGWRQVTVSTVGIVPGIRRLADEDLNINLAVSLHAPDDETRARIVPTARRWRVADIVAAARDFHRRTGRIVTIEYCLLAGVNDSDVQSATLAELLAGFRAHVNLIPYNPTGPGLSGAVFERPSASRIDRFLGILSDHTVVAHIRETRGDAINAACGQLRETVAAGQGN